MKIFCMPSHTFIDRVSGVDFLRIIQPMKHLAKAQGFDVHVYDPSTGVSFDWRDVFQKYDIIYFNYTTNDMGYAVMGAMAQKYGKKLVCDVDDSIWDIQTDNASFDIFKKGAWGREVVTAVLRDVDYVTCTNRYLKNIVAHHTGKNLDKIQVFQNYIDYDFYNHIAKDKKSHMINIGHFGSTSHFNNIVSAEFMKAMTRIMDEYPNVTFTTVGSFFSEFKNKWGQRYTNRFGDADIVKWVKNVYPSVVDDIDFFVTPLKNTNYNLAKSATKYNEVSSSKRPGVWQDIRQYREVVNDGVDGFLCSTEDEWYNAIKKLTDSYELRQKIGNAAYETVKRNFTIQGHVKEYADFFEKVLTTT